ncbi:hypothetical protein AVEN_10688-1 [Araneus ventricosus]|uniref:Uncharacterized protein n=1 Tax=Araneus ventricosus TaxID=182803 RepID=A0A4Y2ET21_ARAVE|nr:hypothetical protein AVEN_10688-1 [Araneus ventricosus]
MGTESGVLIAIVGLSPSPPAGGVVVSYSTCSSPQLDQVQESARPQKITNQRRTFKDSALLYGFPAPYKRADGLE